MNTTSFRQLINDTSKERGPIVLALDYDFEDVEILFHKCIETIKALSPNICCVKINRQLVLPLGLYSGIKEIVNVTHSLGIPVIMDCKINDIGSTNQKIIRHYINAGFDAITASPFVGWDEGLSQIFEDVQGIGKGVILLVYMSHKGAAEGYGQYVFDPDTGKKRPQYVVFTERALSWGADGVVVGATYPEKISEVKSLLRGRIPIYSPGIGFQGGEVERAVDAGTSYLIIGRSIISSKVPYEVTRKIRDSLSKISFSAH